MSDLFASFRGRLREKPPASFSLIVLLLYVVVLSYSLNGDWFIDDREELAFVRKFASVANAFGSDTFGLFRPVKNCLFLLFSHLSGFGVRACRFIGLAIGILSFFPVHCFFRRVFDSEWKAVLSASIWLLSPTLVSSVAWLSCVNIQIMVSFAALVIVFHDKAWNGGSFRYSRIILTSAFLFLALVSYECAIAIVPALILFDTILRSERIRTHRVWMNYACYATTVCLYLTLRNLASAKMTLPGSWCHAERWQLAVSSPWFTVQHFTSWFWPFGRFAVMGNYHWGDTSRVCIVACAVAVFSILTLASLFRKRVPALSFFVFFALLSFAPVSNCLGFGNGPYGDYYLSLASLGLAGGSVELLSVFLQTKPEWRVPALLAVVLFSATRICAIFECARWANLWADPKSAFETSSRNFPRFVSNKVGLVRFVCFEGRYEEALRLTQEIEKTIGSETAQTASIHLVRGIHALLVLKDPQKALEELNLCEDCKSLELTAKRLDFYRGCVFEDLLDNEEEAVRLYESCLEEEWNKESASCADRLARIKAIRGDLPEAIKLWNMAKSVDPRNISVLWNLSVAYQEAGDETRSAELRNLALEQITAEKAQ